jgi:hypothetical protein
MHKKTNDLLMILNQINSQFERWQLIRFDFQGDFRFNFILIKEEKRRKKMLLNNSKIKIIR